MAIDDEELSAGAAVCACNGFAPTVMRETPTGWKCSSCGQEQAFEAGVVHPGTGYLPSLWGG